MFKFFKSLTGENNNKNFIDTLININEYYTKDILNNNKLILKELIDNCIKNNDYIDILKVIFYIRANKNNNLKDISNILFYYTLIKNDNQELNMQEIIYKYLSKIGRWDDWLIFYDNKNINDIFSIKNNQRYNEKINSIRNIINNILIRQIITDLKDLNKTKISLCAKWLPSENKSVDKKLGIVSILSELLYCEVVKDNEILKMLDKNILENIVKKNKKSVYRLILALLRNNMNLIETYLCQNRYIDKKYIGSLSKNAQNYYKRKIDALGYYKDNSGIYHNYKDLNNNWKRLYLKLEQSQNGQNVIDILEGETYTISDIHKQKQSDIHVGENQENEHINDNITDIDTVSEKSIIEKDEFEYIDSDKKYKNLEYVRQVIKL